MSFHILIIFISQKMIDVRRTASTWNIAIFLHVYINVDPLFCYNIKFWSVEMFYKKICQSKYFSMTIPQIFVKPFYPQTYQGETAESDKKIAMLLLFAWVVKFHVHRVLATQSASIIEEELKKFEGRSLNYG